MYHLTFLFGNSQLVYLLHSSKYDGNNKSLDPILARFTNIREGATAGQTLMSFPINYIYEILYYWLESQGNLSTEISNNVHRMLTVMNLLNIQKYSNNKNQILKVIVIHNNFFYEETCEHLSQFNNKIFYYSINFCCNGCR
jgi:hypothetical protein